MFSDYIVYVDESGDHSLTSIDPIYPVFVLAFCVFHKETYARTIAPAFKQLKFDFWGHDGVVLHGHEIRKSKGDFSILLNAATRNLFFGRLNGVLDKADFTVIAAVIDKNRLVAQYAYPANPYEIALVFCMERLQRSLFERGQSDRRTHVMVECRGAAEDQSLELEFRRICDGHNAFGQMPNLEIRFMDKKHNSTGLQIADLVAHPIGRHVIKPAQANRAYDVIEPKFRRSQARKVKGYGLKIFP
jgi:Protein of unknown function (DUF3800)